MRFKAFYETVNIFASMAGMVITGLLLVTTIFLTYFDLPWVAFLSGILCAAAIGLVSRLAYAETALAAVRQNVRYIDDELPMMVVYISADGIVRFHNQAFRIWLRARRETINGHPLRDVVGLTIYGQLKSGLDTALAGRMVHETRIHEGLGSSETLLFTQYLPNVESGAISGAFLLQTDITSLDVPTAVLPPPAPAPALVAARTAPPPAPFAPASTAPPSAAPASTAPGPAMTAPFAVANAERERRIFVNTLAEELSDGMNAGERLRSALDNDEFCLYCQTIRPLDASAAEHEAPFYEILIRLREEEEGLMPPGAFLPLAEEYGLLPELDRWVVRHVVEWSRAKPERRAITFAINISAATISNPDFADFVASELQRQGASGSVLCFEIADADAYSRLKDIGRLISTLGGAGVRTTLSGFGHNAESFALLKYIAVDFLKIDGDIILDLHRNPVALTKLKAIMRVAQATNRGTIAEFVESDQTLVTLREFGVGYVQGFGIALPRPLSDLD